MIDSLTLVFAGTPRSAPSGFFPWQTKNAELYVVQHPWPAFSETDLDDALGYYGAKRGEITEGRP